MKVQTWQNDHKYKPDLVVRRPHHSKVFTSRPFPLSVTSQQEKAKWPWSIQVKINAPAFLKILFHDKQRRKITISKYRRTQ